MPWPCPRRLLQRADKVGQRLGTLAEVRHQRRPVVHLQVDIVVVVHAPGSVDVVVPDTLEVGGHIARTRRGDEQVAAELVVERFEALVLGALAIGFQAFVGGQGGGGLVQLERHAAEKGGVVAQVGLQEFVPGGFAGLAHPSLGRCQRIDAHIRLRIVEVGVVVGLVIGVGCEENHDLIGIAHHEGATFGGECATLGLCLQAKDKLHSVVVESSLVEQVAVGRCRDLTFGTGIWRIGQTELLLALL